MPDYHDDTGSDATRCTRGLVDVHAHCLPPFYKDALASAGLVGLDGGFPVPGWSAEAAIDVMNRGASSADIVDQFAVIAAPGWRGATAERFPSITC